MKECHTVAKISSLLLSKEKLLKQQATQLSENFNALLTVGSNTSQRKKFHGNSSPQGRFNNNNIGGNIGYNRGAFGFSRGRGRERSNFNQPQCQLCGRFDHTVFKCYHRFDQNFQQSQTGQTSQMIAMLASTKTFNDLAWFANSKATNHYILTVENLHCMTPYAGQEKIVVDNGTRLDTNAIGNFSSNFGQFSLNNILDAPKIAKSLLNVSQFTRAS